VQLRRHPASSITRFKRDNHAELFLRSLELQGFDGTYTRDLRGKNGVVVLWVSRVCMLEGVGVPRRMMFVCSLCV
jgi:hypothetical protein